MIIETAALRTDDTIEIDESDVVLIDDRTTDDAQLMTLASESAAINALAEYDRADARFLNRQAGRVGWALLWLLGVPLPVLLIIYLIRGH